MKEYTHTFINTETCCCLVIIVLHRIENSVFFLRTVSRDFLLKYHINSLFSNQQTMNVGKSAVTGDLARRNVCSAIIKNQTSDKIHCLVEYQTLSGTENEFVEFNLNGNGEEQKCEEKIHTTGTKNTDASYSTVFPKVIHSLNVQKSDGSKLELKAPFDNVPHENVRNWNFIVDNDQIHSVKG